jgi:sec-independent protein translocase protein TatB
MLPNIGLGELALIFLVLLLAVGPSRLPEIARALGKAYQTFQRETTKAKDAFKEVFDEPTGEIRQMMGELRGTRDDVTKTIEDSRKQLKGAGVIDRPDEPVIPGSGAVVEPADAPGPIAGSSVAPGAGTDGRVDPHARPAQAPRATTPDIASHPTNPIVRDYEDT